MVCLEQAEGISIRRAVSSGLLRIERVIESVTYEAAGCGKCVQHNRNPQDLASVCETDSMTRPQGQTFRMFLLIGEYIADQGFERTK